jgi:type II secretory pathway component PulM
MQKLTLRAARNRAALIKKEEFVVKKLAALLVLFGLLLFVTQPALSQKPDEDIRAIKKDIQSLKEGQANIQKELREVKNLLQTKQAPPAKPQNIIMSVEGAHFKGDKNAKVTLIEFSDFQ